MPSHACRLRAQIVLAVVVFAAPRALHAASLVWNNPAGGSAAAAGNWTPNQVPMGADDLTMSLNATYTVTYNASVTSSKSHKYRAGTVTLNMSSAHTTSGNLTVADAATDVATLTLTTGTFNVSGFGVIGNTAGSDGTLNVNDSDADLIITGGMTLGQNGAASLSISGVGHVEVGGNLIVGSNSTSICDVSVSGFSVAPLGASLLDVLGVGESRIGQGGDATMSVSNGAVARFAGDLVIANGAASVSSVTVQTAGLLAARLLVGDDLLVGSNSSGTAAGTGTLNINTGGLVDATGDTFLGDANGGTGDMVLAGGTFHGALPVNLLTAASGISGTGTVNADVNVGTGSISPSGASGLTFGGTIFNTANNISGTTIHFASTGGYSGSGSCAVDVTGDPTALITATGTLALGRATAAGVSYDGQLAVGSQAVTLVDSNGGVLAGLVTIGSGGNLSCSNGIGLSLGGRIQGDGGTITGNLTCAGALDPQRSPTPGGILTLTGDLLMNSSGSYEMEIGGPPASAMHDRANVSGTATFDGTLKLSIPNGYLPKVGEQFVAINAAGGRSGTFATIVPPSPAPCSGVTFVAVYSSTAAIVLVRPPLGCTALGDLNSNGNCEGRDIQIFVNALITGSYNSCADMNGDCANTAADIPVFIACLL
ncbi:MAG: hypothetical protein U1A27_07190 [Phycisphaerae bacterium]